MSSKTKLVLDRASKNIQGSVEWLEERRELITATDVASILPAEKDLYFYWSQSFGQYEFNARSNQSFNPYRDYKQFIHEKIHGKQFISNEACQWGQTFEDVARLFYALISNDKVHVPGLIKHHKYNFIAASLDGITNKGRLVEIKCPLKRQITRIVPLMYWCQIQIQLEITDLEICDFMDVEIRKYNNSMEMLNDFNISDFKKGCLLLQDKTVNTNIPPTTLCIHEKLKWCTEQLLHKNDNEHWHIVYYYIYDYQITPVYRNKNFFNAILPRIYGAWSIIKPIQ